MCIIYRCVHNLFPEKESSTLCTVKYTYVYIDRESGVLRSFRVDDKNIMGGRDILVSKCLTFRFYKQ